MRKRRSLELVEGPVRTCLGCGTRRAIREVLRFGVDKAGRLELDGKKYLPGRGVYCCPQSRCLAIFARKRGRILKALRLDKVDFGLVEQLLGEYRSGDADFFN